MSKVEVTGEAIRDMAVNGLGSGRLDHLDDEQLVALYMYAQEHTLPSEQREGLNILIVARLTDWLHININAFSILKRFIEKPEENEDIIPEWVLKYPIPPVIPYIPEDLEIPEGEVVQLVLE